MSALIRGGALIENEWTELADDVPLPASGKIIVGLGRLRADNAALAAASALEVGVKVPNTEDVPPLWPELKDRPLIALEFPKAVDGRAFSQARLLRERLGFKGEIRAIGDVMRDQLQFMQRCGFDTYQLRADQDVQDCLKAFADFDLAYQNATDALPNVWALRRAAG